PLSQVRPHVIRSTVRAIAAAAFGASRLRFNRPAPTKRALPVEPRTFLDLPLRVVSLQLLPLELPQPIDQMSDWRRLINQTYQRLVCGDLYHRLQTEGPRQPPTLPECYFVDYGNAEYMKRWQE
uniref:DUF3825 domain-containing protein n=1 Tax=Macrostomum lignano TaxID=282301 RepID=A0A1I8FGR9_9PLAT